MKKLQFFWCPRKKKSIWWSKMKKVYSYQESSPIIELELTGPRRKIITLALVDSGASISLFRSEIADLLGIPLKKGREVSLFGIGGGIKGYLHQIPIRINKTQFDCKIIFSREMEVSINLLGRDNFFLPFLITFNEKLQKVYIEGN